MVFDCPNGHEQSGVVSKPTGAADQRAGESRCSCRKSIMRFSSTFVISRSVRLAPVLPRNVNLPRDRRAQGDVRKIRAGTGPPLRP